MSTLTQQAEQLLAYSKQLDSVLEAQKLPPPGFDRDVFASIPAEQQEVWTLLVESVNTFQKLVRGPTMGLMDMLFTWTDLLVLRVIYSFNLAQAVPLDGHASYAEIAQASGLNEELVRRYLRAAMSNHIFAENNGRVRHTAISRLIASSQGVRDVIGLEIVEFAPSAVHVVDAMEKFGQDAYEPNQTGWRLANNTDHSIFEMLAKEPERSRRFNSAMQYLTSNESWDLRHLLAGYNWHAIDRPGVRVVDIGGGAGHVACYIAQYTKHLHFTVQDLPHTIPDASANLSPNLKDRVRFVGHDFFTPQSSEPPTDVFLFRWILHDWSDHYATAILRNLVPAMRPSSKVLIWENVLPDTPSTTHVGRFSFQLDMIVGSNFGGKERSREQFEKLLAQADQRFVLTAIHQPPGSSMNMVEISWNG